MVIKTKYDTGDNLYFLDDGAIRYLRAVSITIRLVSKGDNGESFLSITYNFWIGRKVVSKEQTEVFKRRADLIRYYEYE